MSGIVIGNTLRTSWKQILYWGLGLGVLGTLHRLHRHEPGHNLGLCGPVEVHAARHAKGIRRQRYRALHDGGRLDRLGFCIGSGDILVRIRGDGRLEHHRQR